jgi:hypothetical protein
MNKDEALRLALEALEYLATQIKPDYEHSKAITAIKAALEAKDETVKLRRGDILRCIETDELCTVWATSTSGKTLVKWGGNDFTDYTAEQIGELFWIEPKEQDEKHGSPCPEFWDWLPKAYRDGDIGDEPKFTKYNMEVAFLAGKQSFALEAKDEPHGWKLVPIKPTDEMLKAMDECSTEGYDERLYAGYAASVYMAAVDVAPNPSQQNAGDLAKLGWQYFECPACGSEGARAFPKQKAKDEPVAWMFQHEETGRTMCVDAQQLEWGFEKGNPRLKKIAPLYTTPPQRTWVGLTDKDWNRSKHNYDFQKGVDWAESILKEKNNG